MNKITEIAEKHFGKEALTPEFAARLEGFAKDVAETERNRVQAAYERLSMLHSETMIELVNTRKQLEQRTLWWDIKRRVRRLFRRLP